MKHLIVEVPQEEVGLFDDAHIEHEAVETQNLDGSQTLSVIITIASLPVTSLLVDVLMTIAKKRQKSSIKINGIEMSNVSQELIEKVLAEQDKD